MSPTAAATTVLTGDYTITVPMTTLFTPPAACRTHWTYENSRYNSVENGILLQNVVNNPASAIDSSCFPSGWAGYGRAYSGQVFSPGACPISYTTVTELTGGDTTTGVCCYSDFSYYGTISTINYGGTGAANFVGCISTFPSGSSTSVPGRQQVEKGFLVSTEVTGPITMWAQALTIEYRLNDLALYPALTSSSSSASSITSTSSTKSSATPSSGRATATATPTSTSTSTTSQTISTSTIRASSTKDSSSRPNSVGLSTGAQAAIGISVSFAGLALLVVGFCVWKMRRRRQLGNRASENPYIDHKPIPLSDGPSKTASVKSPTRTIHQLPAEPEPSELYGSVWQKP